MAAELESVRAGLEALGVADDDQRPREPPALQITQNTDPASHEIVNGSNVLAAEDELRALILNLEATKQLSIDVEITEVNEFSGPATLSISKVAFVKRQIEDREPHFVGISEVKNKGGRGNAEGETELLGLLSDRHFGYLSVHFNDEYLIHGWDTSKYRHINDGVELKSKRKGMTKQNTFNNFKQSDGSWGYGFRYIWTRLEPVDAQKTSLDAQKTSLAPFILVTCHMPTQKTTQKNGDDIEIEAAWKELMKFIETQNKNGVPILLMGDTNLPWALKASPNTRSKALRLQKVIGLDSNPPNPYPHLALMKDGHPATTTGYSYIDNFIFFYKDGKEHNDDFQKKYRVHYHRLGWTTHHVLVFKFNKSLLEY